MGVAIIVVLVILCIILFRVRKKIKKLTLPNVYLITGGVKTGKTLLSVHLAIKYYKKNLFWWYVRFPFEKFKKFFNEKLRKNKVKYDIPLKPVLFSNIPLAYVKYSALTIDVILRKVRLPLNSVVLIDEISLLVDSMMIQSDYINTALKNFFKLFAHANGNNAYCICNTQSFSDNHYNVKRCTGSYLWIHKKTKLPFITLFKVREMLNVDEHSINTTNEDFESSLLTLWTFNRTYKKYDSRCFSSLTDYLPYAEQNNFYKTNKDSLKANDVLSLQQAYQYFLDLQRKGKGARK